MDAERDASELSLIPPLLDSGLPCLLICRGAQLLNVALGGTLHSHLPEAYGASLAHRAMAAEAGETTHVLHEVELLPQTLLASLLGVERATVASWHHQAPAEVAPGLVVSAQAPDGVIEAIEMPGHPWLLGVQWHPEITAGHDPLQQRIFDSLVDAARQGS
jgi:putative glutamine amidotransferase